MPRRDERAEYERLHAIYGQPPRRERRRPRPPVEDDDDSPVIMLSGRRADAFLSSLFGHDDQGDDEDQSDEDDEDQGDEDDEDPDEGPDPEPAPGHAFFRGRRRG